MPDEPQFDPGRLAADLAARARAVADAAHRDAIHLGEAPVLAQVAEALARAATTVEHLASTPPKPT